MLTIQVMGNKKNSGTCLLTGSDGPFVDSHLIPLALTRLSRTGEKYVEAGIGLGIKTRANSWYDGSLVTRVGEDILAAIDSKAIAELRDFQLVWSGWGPEARFQPNGIVQLGEDAVSRLISIERAHNLQLFFLSLLWRAAATSRPEFKEIALKDDVIEDLRRRVLAQDPGRFADYPIQLFQIVTKGPLHNRVPLLERKAVLRIDGSKGPEVDYVRFYFDGLIAHVHLALGMQLNDEYLNTCLGFQKETTVFLHEFESSRTAADLREMVLTVDRENFTIDVPLVPIAEAIRKAWPRTGQWHASKRL